MFTLRGEPDAEREPTDGRPHTDDDGGAHPTGRLRALRAVAARTCFYSVAEDERFIVEPVGRALVLAGFSGHGFKFGAVMGEAAAAALIGERSLSAVRPGRRAEAERRLRGA